jgi:hypothetical protein
MHFAIHEIQENVTHSLSRYICPLENRLSQNDVISPKHRDFASQALGIREKQLSFNKPNHGTCSKSKSTEKCVFKVKVKGQSCVQSQSQRSISLLILTLVVLL